MKITVMHSTDNAFEGWSQEDLDNINIEASASKLNASIREEVQKLYPAANITIDSGNYQDTAVEVEGAEPGELVEEYVRDAIGRAYGAMDWVVK